MHSALSFVVAPFMIPKLLAFVLLSHRRVNRTDTKKQVCLALLGRQTSYRLLFRPIGCCCCASRSSLPPPPETLAGEERMAAPGPNSCLLAIRTCISHLATSLLHSSGCRDCNTPAPQQKLFHLYFWTCYVPATKSHCSHPSSCNLFCQMSQLSPHLPREALMLCL